MARQGDGHLLRAAAAATVITLRSISPIARRTILSTSLVGYNCYRPPRNAEEFREFARLMPSRAIGNELDGLEPCSPVYNFRYPEMRRFRYENMRTLPAGLVAVGDAYCSADPVSGAGMTKALLELDELRRLLRAGCLATALGAQLLSQCQPHCRSRLARDPRAESALPVDQGRCCASGRSISVRRTGTSIGCSRCCTRIRRSIGSICS